jgi:hypothetical protein
MPRLESSGSSGEGFSIPWRGVALVAIIGGSIWYGVHQYARLHPDIPRAVPGRVLNRQRPKYDPKSVLAGMKPFMEKVNLTADQKEKLEAAAAESTNTVAFRRKAMQVLTEEQRKQVRSIQETVTAERRKRQGSADAAGNQAAAEKGREERVRREREERRKARETTQPATK